MSFWKSFLGSALAQAAKDGKKEKQQLAEWNALFSECMDMDTEFNVFLQSVGIDGSYSSPSGLPDEGRAAVNAEKRRIEAYRNKINEFIALGGKASNVWSFEKIEDYLARIKYLRANGYLDSQDDWIQMDIEMLKTLIPKDIEVKRIMQEAKMRIAEQEQREALANTIGVNIDTLSGKDFEFVCQRLVEKMGFSTQITKSSGDGGIDIIAYNSQPLLSGKYIIQCKRYSGSVGEPILRDLYGVVTSERANKGILMTTGRFTRQAVTFADGKPLELIDGVKLKELLLQYQLMIQPKSSECTIEDFLTSLNDDGISLDENVVYQLSLEDYSSYSSLERILITQPENHSARSRMIDLIMQAYLWDDRLSDELDVPVETYKRCLAQLLREEIGRFCQFADDKDIKAKTAKDFYFIYLAEIELAAGNLYNAYRAYELALDSKTLASDSAESKDPYADINMLSFGETIARIVMNMCQIMAVAGLPEKANALAKEYHPLLKYHFGIAEEVYHNNCKNSYAKIEYDWYKNPSSATGFKLLDYEGYLGSDDITQNLYDQSVYSGYVVDSTLTTYSRIRKTLIYGSNISIAFSALYLDLQKIIDNNKERLRTK